MAYIGFEPYVRRLWPRTLTSSTRALSGQVRDPLVGRDMLLGMFSAVCLAGMLILRLRATGSDAPEMLAGPALDTLRSTRTVVFWVTLVVLDGLSYSVAGLFFLVVIRLVVRKTWIACVVAVAVMAPLTPGGVSGVGDLPYAAVFRLIALLTTLRGGLLAATVMHIGERLLTRFPLTLDVDAWYFGLSLMILLLVVPSLCTASSSRWRVVPHSHTRLRRRVDVC
jgi:serine/threonine-protein kinase